MDGDCGYSCIMDGDIIGDWIVGWVGLIVLYCLLWLLIVLYCLYYTSNINNYGILYCLYYGLFFRIICTIIILYYIGLL